MTRRGIAVVALGLTLGQASRAQEVEQIGPPATASVGAITSEPGGTVAPIGGGAGGKEEALAAPLLGGTIEATMAGAVIGRLRARTLTPEAAWKSGALDVDTLLYIVGERLGPWGGFFWERDDALRRALVKLLVEHGGDKIKDTSKLPITVRLWMADYYGNIGDERVLALAESVIADIKPGGAGQEDVALQAVERLGWFYRDKGEHEKSAQSWLRLEPMLKVAGWQVPDSLLEAARAWDRAEQEQKAQALYARVMQQEDGWLAGMAVWFQADHLISKEHHSEARALLQNRVKEAKGEGADNVRVALLSLLGYSHYRSGDFKQAKMISQQALAQYKALAQPKQGRGLEGQVERAKATIKWAECFSKQSVLCAPQKLFIVVAEDTSLQNPEKSSRVLVVRSLHSLQLDVVSDHPHLKVYPPEDVALSSVWYSKSKIRVEVMPQASKSFEANVLITSPSLPGLRMQVPVHVEFQQKSNP